MNLLAVASCGPILRCAGTAGLWLCTVAVQAQGAAPYKVTGADGRVTYTDRPAADAKSVRPVGRAAPAQAGAEMLDGLPYALREAALRYPVVLYTASTCSPCDVARQTLQQRGVPFREWQVPTQGGAELARREGSNSLPILKVGNSKLVGYNATEWRQTLDAAGYPVSNTLPPHWQAPAAQPLPMARAAEPTAAAVSPRGPASAPEAQAASAGAFRF
jgi:glutaredoxin